MSASRSFQAQIDELKLLINNTNERQVKIILEALLHPEHLQSQTFTTTHIQKLTDENLKKTLHEINSYLRNQYGSKSEEYVSGNADYELLISFWDTQADVQQKQLEVMLANRIEKLKDLHNEVLLELREFNGDYKDTPLRSSYEKAKEKESCFNAAIFDMVVKLKDSGLQKQYTEFLVDAKTDCSTLKLQYFKTLSMQVYSKIEYDIQCLEEKTTTMLNTTYIEAVELLKEECALELIKTYMHPWLRKSYANLFELYSSADRMLSLANMQKLRLHGNDLNEMPNVGFVPPPANLKEIFESHLLDGDEQIGNGVRPLKQSPLWKLLHFNLTYCQFKEAMRVCTEEEMKLGRKPYTNYRLEHLHQAFSIIMINSGGGNDLIRKVNYIVFIHNTIEELKKYKKNDKDNLTAFVDLLENAFISLWRSIVWRDSLASQSLGINLIKEKISYYELVCKQKYYMMMADLLTQMRRLNKNSFTYMATELLISQNISRDKYTKYYESYGFDGLFDILLDNIAELEELILISKSQFNIENNSKNQFHKISQAESAAEAAFQELITAFEMETKTIKAQSKVAMEKKKLSHKKKKKPNPQQLFSPSASNTLPEELSDQAKQYLEVGRKLTVSKDPDQAIQEYEKIVATYLQSCDEKTETAQDYFYVTATFVELTDCYNNKALKSTPADFCSLEKADADQLLQWYEQAYQCAKHAEDCFINHVAPNINSYAEKAMIKHFEDLAANVHSFLRSATDKLVFMRSHYDNLITKLEEQLENLQQQRMQLKNQLGYKWVNNPAPKNIYRNLREKIANNITTLKTCTNKMNNFVTQKMQPLRENFSYLCGNSPLPLIENASSYSEDSRQDKSTFQHRLVCLAENKLLLKAGDLQPTHSQPRLLLLST